MKWISILVVMVSLTARAQFVPFAFIGTNGGAGGGGGGGVTLSTNALHFATTADSLTRANFTGEADGKTGIISYFAKMPAELGGQVRVFWNPGLDFDLTKLSANSIRLSIFNDTGSTLSLQMTSTATTLCDGSYHHVLMAWDSSDSTKCHIVVDGVEGTTVNVCLNNNLNYTLSEWRVSDASVNGFTGDITGLVFAPNQWLDITSAANVQKFRNASGKQVDLIASSPGISMIVYINNTAASPGTNLGTGGNFTVTGAPTNATPP